MALCCVLNDNNHDDGDDVAGVAALVRDARKAHTRRRKRLILQSTQLRSMKRDFSFSSLNYFLSCFDPLPGKRFSPVPGSSSG